MNPLNPPCARRKFVALFPAYSPSSRQFYLLLLVAVCALPSATWASTYYWDASPNLSGTFLNYGSGTISTTSSNWWNTSNGTYVGWTNSSGDVMQIGSTSVQDGRSYTGGGSTGSFALTISGTIALGELVISSNLSSGGANTVTITDGGNTANTLTFGGANEIQNNSSNPLIIDAEIASAGGTLFDESSGTVIFTKNNGYNTGTTIEGNGTTIGGALLQIGNSGATGALGTGQVQFLLNTGQTSADTLRFDRSDAIAVANSINIVTSNTIGAIIQQSGGNSLTLSGSETISSASAILTYNIGATGQSIDTLVSGVITGAGSVAKTGAGTLSFSGTDNYTGATAITAGTLMIGGAGQLGAGSYAGNISNSGTFIYNSTAAQTLSGVISGGGNLIQNGSGTLTLSNSNTYTGTTTINASTLTLAGFNSNGLAQGALPNTNVTVNSGATFQFGTAANYGNAATGSAPTPVAIGQNVTLNNGTLAEVTGTSGANGATAVSLSGTLTLGSGLNFVTINGAGVGSHYTGFTTGFLRNAGTTLLINAPHTIGTNAPGTAGSENLLLTSGTTLTATVLAGVFISQSSTPLDATTIAIYNSTDGVASGGATAYPGTSGSLGNTLNPIAWVSSGNYTGTASGSVNSLRLDDSMNLGGFTLTVNSGMILARGNFNITTGTLALGAEGQIYVSNNDTSHTANAAHAMTISSVITGSNGLTYIGGWTGQGTLTLSGDDTYTGATTINTGTLLVSGSLAGTTSATINNTGVLAGGGMVGAVVSTGTTGVNAGGTIAPGATLGTAGTKLTLNTSVMFNNGSTFAVNLDATNDKVDLLAINGNLTLNGGDALTVDLVNGSLPGNSSYEIASYTGTLTGTFVTPSSLTTAGYQVDYSHTGEILIDVAAIPEPGTYAMMLAGFATLLGIQRVRRRRL